MITPISAHTSTLLTSLPMGKKNGFLQNPQSNTLKLKVVLVFKYQNGNTSGHKD
jgi:hypothetical protein